MKRPMDSGPIPRSPLAGWAMGVLTWAYAVYRSYSLRLFNLGIGIRQLDPARRGKAMHYVARHALMIHRKYFDLEFGFISPRRIPEEPCVLVSNHGSAWDTFFFASYCNGPVGIVAKRELRRIPGFGKALEEAGAIYIDRTDPTEAMRYLIKESTRLLGEGWHVAIFPQGTRMAGGQGGQWSASGALIAKQAGVPLVPMVHNAAHFWPKKFSERKSGVISVEIGEPIDMKGKSPKKVMKDVQQWVESSPASQPDVPYPDPVRWRVPKLNDCVR